MIIQHNIPALNSYNKLSTNNSAVQKNLEKLSSGYRINRAGDDAAGLAISEKMRAQITGLERAKLNAQDGISLVQTAEGALTEVHSILNRLVELGTESANGIYQADDRQKIQDEVDQSLEEIDRISKATNFNGINLLDGSLGTSSAAIKKADTSSIGLVGTDAVKGEFTVTSTQATTDRGDTVSYTINYERDGERFKFEGVIEQTGSTAMTATDVATKMKEQLKESGLNDLFDISSAGGVLTFTAKDAGTAGAQIVGAESTFKSATAAPGTPGANGTHVNMATATTANRADSYTTVSGMTALTSSSSDSTIQDNILEVNGQKFAVVADMTAAKMMADKHNDVNVVIAANQAAANNALAALIEQKSGIKTEVNGGALRVYASSTSSGSGKGGLTLQVGDTGDDFNKVTVSVDNMSSSGLGINDLRVTDQGIAADSIDRIKGAIEKVSTNRGRLGALQNRLEHTINNLAVTTENMTAAESRVRDTDMAKEMMNFTKNNVLVQSAQAMLAQANQQPQQVLQLLR